MFSLTPKQWESLAKLHFWLDDIIGCDCDGNPVSSLQCGIVDFIPLLPLE